MKDIYHKITDNSTICRKNYFKNKVKFQELNFSWFNSDILHKDIFTFYTESIQLVNMHFDVKETSLKSFGDNFFY